MTPTISPGMGALPQASPQPAMSLQQVLAGGSNLGNDSINSNYGMPDLGVPTGVGGVQPQVTGGGGHAITGAGAVSQEQLATALQQVISAVNALVAALQAQGGVGATGGGAGASVGQCGMAGCTMDHSAPQGANGGVEAAQQSAAQIAPAAQGASKARKAKKAPKSTSSGAGTAPAGNAPSTSASRAPLPAGSAKDKTSTSGLTPASMRGLEVAHKFGLPLVSGKRSGGGGSDHDHGNAVDVGTLPIGVASSDGATPAMVQYREHMRAEGKAGRLDVKYIISDGKIASANGNWEWRPYTYPGKSAASLEALKKSNPGEYNRLQHFDHVHVSFN